MVFSNICEEDLPFLASQVCCCGVNSAVRSIQGDYTEGTAEGQADPSVCGVYVRLIDLAGDPVTVDEDGHPRRFRLSIWWSGIDVIGKGVYMFLGHTATGAVIEEIVFVHGVGVMAEGLRVRWSCFSQNVEGWSCFKGELYHIEEFLALHESSPDVCCGDTKTGVEVWYRVCGDWGGGCMAFTFFGECPG